MVKGWKVFDLNKSQTLSFCFGEELSSIFLNQNIGAHRGVPVKLDPNPTQRTSRKREN